MTRDRFPMVVHVLLLRGGAGPAAASIYHAAGASHAAGAAAEMYLLRRAGTGFMDGYYVLPGGHVTAGESLESAAARECGEETGVIPGRLRPLCVLPYRSGRHQGVNFVFEGAELPGEPGIGEPERSDAAGWYAVEQLPEPVAPWLGDVLELRGRGEWFRELYWR